MHSILKTTRRRFSRMGALLAGILLAFGVALEAQAASSWKPTLLVNTESFQTIDEGDSTTNIELKFGDTLKESLFYNRTAQRFQFTRSLYIQGDLTATGSLSIKQVMSGTHLRVDKNADVWGNLSVSGTTILDGNVGIGVTGTPDTKLEVSGTMSGSSVWAQDRLTSSGALSVDGTAYLNSSEVVTGTSTTSGNIYGSGSLFIETNANISGTALVGGNVTINDDNGAADAVLTFGNDAGAETMQFNDTTNEFDLSDDLNVTGTLDVSSNLAASGTLSITGAASFGSTVKLNGVVYTFPYGDGTASGKVLKTDGNGNLTWATDAGSTSLSYTDGDSRYVNTSGDTMTGALNVRANLSGSSLTVDGTADIFGNLGVSGTTLVDGNIYGSGSLFIETNANISGNELVGGNLAASGTLSIEGAAAFGSTLDTVGTITTDADLTINQDNGAADAVLTFGNDAGAETLKFNDTTNEFDLSDDLNVTGTLDVSSNLAASGTLSVTGAASFGSTVKLNGQTYTFPTTNGDANQVLTTDGDGTLTWASKNIGIGSGGVFSISPEYPDAVYTASGASYVGQLTYDYDATNNENYYKWVSTKSTLQDYWIAVRARVPDNYSAWDNVRPIQFRYLTGSGSSAASSLSVRLLDTTGTQINLTNGENLASTSWTTALITGPESAGTYTAGSYITILIKLRSRTSWAAWAAQAGFLNVNWETTAP